MTVNVIGVPAVGQFIESLVFNIPALVRHAYDPFGSRLGHG
jgi:hypothetical protein